MNLHYPLSWPFSRFFARCGVPTCIRLDVIRDEEADVFIGSSVDLPGLVVEASSLEDIAKEAGLLIPDMLQAAHSCARDVTTDIRYRGRIAHA